MVGGKTVISKKRLDELKDYAFGVDPSHSSEVEVGDLRTLLQLIDKQREALRQIADHTSEQSTYELAGDALALAK
jgi:hypothetical protein